ncbi:hypothetical protein GIY56_06140 [Paracoccus sp. YIM 132242]|uniref:Uncharacterized protein n=1 Tax=Paracoccus lichenicola TaxID=2665644 RepID=A0A6L6HNK2_9RHOB|nr:hypothetical protein [Paracoccus lichenicola]MTD99859.1 hypothetical protein [Paracoccus lichenicola]
MFITLNRNAGRTTFPITIAINHIVAFEPYLTGEKTTVHLAGLKGTEGHQFIVDETVDAIQRMITKAQLP